MEASPSLMLLFGDTDNLFTSDLEIGARLFDYLASLLLQTGKCGRPEQIGEQWFIVVETALISISSLTEIHLRDVTIAFNIKLNQHINCISLSITSVLLLTEEWVCKDWIDENFSDFFDNLLERVFCDQNMYAKLYTFFLNGRWFY